MDRAEFSNLLHHGEDTWLDWKRDFPRGMLGGRSHPDWDEAKATLLKDLVSLANSDISRPGFLVYGVKDHGSTREVMGISKTWDDADFQTWAENQFNPPIKFSYQEIQWKADITTVGIFIVERSFRYPHVAIQGMGGIIADGQVWFRRGSRNTVAHYEDLQRIFSGDEPFKVGRGNDPIVEEITKRYQQQGDEVTLPLMGDKDSLLMRGYHLAYYPPGTRREVWVGEHRGRYELILMLKPKQT